MIMSYDEYIKTVPKETTEFVNLVLKLFDNFIVNDCSIWPDDNIKIESKESKIFACLIFAKYHLGNNDRTKFILNGLEVKESFINFYDIKELEKTEIDYDYVFSKTSSIFLPFIYVENYIYLTPERILYEYHKTFRDEIKLQNIFDKSPWHKMFEEDYSKYVLSKENDLMKPIELGFYKDLSYDLISYLNKTARIFRFFEKYQSNDRAYNHDIIKTCGDVAIASLLLSVYFWEDNKVLTFFENMGLSKKLCESILIPYYDLENYDDIKECAILIKYFKRYLDDGINKDIEKKDLTIEKIIGNIFDRNFTNSLILETVLHKAGLSISDFDDFENKIKGFEKQYEHIERGQRIQKFFGNTPNKTIEFVEFVSKIHKVIEENFKNGKCQKYITNENDISALSFFIGSYFVPNDFICYFRENGVTQGKVINSLGLNIKKEELEQIEVDIDLIINNYNDIVFGYTQTKEQVDINAVLFSLGNSQKIKSDSILKLVKDVNPNLRIFDNFTDFVIDYNKKQEEIRKYNLEQKFFGDMQKKSIEFIKKVSQVYQALENSDKTVQFNVDDLVQIAILYTAIFYTSDETKFLGTLKSANIADTLNVYNNYTYTNSISNYTDSIDIIYSKFGKYIFGGKNKGKNKCDLTIKDIYKNIFDKGNCSVALCKFLDDIGFNYKKFINFDESFIEYKKQTMINNVERSLERESKKYYFENLSQIYKCLLNMCKEEKLVYNINDNIEEIKNAARLLSILISEHEAIEKFLLLLSKRGIDLKNYLQYLNISFDDFNKYKMEEIDYLLIGEEFDEYNNYHDYSLFSGHEPGIISIIRDLFKEHDNGYLYEGFIKFLNQSPEIIEKEMETGEEVIRPLSKDEQINYFMSMPIDTIDYSLNSMSQFGRDLSDHSIMIANEFVNIAIMDNDNERVLNIQEEINKLTRKPKLFAKKKSISEKIADNKEVLDNLNNVLKENEARMIEVIDHFGYLKKLIVAYVYRLNKYIETLQNAIGEYEKTMPNSQNSLENIDNQTILQTLYDKLNDYQSSLIISVGQYQKISLLLNTYFVNLNKTTNARNTVIPNLYIELSIRDSIILERESIADLNSINDLLNSIVKANNQILDKSTFQIRDNNGIPKELIESIKNELSDGNLITFDTDNNVDDSLKQIKKK